MVCRCCETSCSEQKRKRRLAADVGTVSRSNTASHLLNPQHRFKVATFVLFLHDVSYPDLLEDFCFNCLFWLILHTIIC